MAETILRIFVSSPSDVAGERARVKLVADRLNGELEGIVKLDVLRWEDGFYTAASSFQQAIDAAIGNMTATDMVLCIVWKRAGLKLNPAIWQRQDGSSYESGTVLEFETAVDVSRNHNGTPDVYLFRKSADVLYRADKATEEMEQYQLLQSVWKRWTESAEGYNTAGYQSFLDADDFETKLEACLRQWLARRGVVASGPYWDRTLKGSPFRGLAAFDAAHAAVFFGREAAIARGTAKLRAAPFLLLIGGSGSGKSSLMRAGLVPRITAPGVIAEVDLWRTALIVPGADVLGQLAEALFADGALGAELRAGDFNTAALLAELFAAGGNAALAPLRTALARAAQARAQAARYDAPRPARLAIAVDQLERLFFEVEGTRAEAFAALLKALVEAELASVIAALRSDAYGQFQASPALLGLLEQRGATLDLLPPSANELEDIVTRPVAACHPPLAYEANAHGRPLAELLVADARGGDALPLLQMTLQRLFDAEAGRGDGVLRLADYPGMDAAVTATAEEAVAGLRERARAALPNLLTAFVRDVTIDADGNLQSLVIVPVARATFERGDPDRTALIDEFIARRLLTTEQGEGGIVRVRPVHEALLRVVPAAVAVIKDNAALIRVRHTLEPMVAEWRNATPATKNDFLVTSPALIAGAAQLAERLGAELPDDMRGFIADSLAADARRREAERTRARRIIMATAAGLVIAVVLGSFAAFQWKQATEQRAVAETQRAVAEQARQQAQNNADRALRNFHASSDQAEALIVTLGGQLKTMPGVTREALRLILSEGQRQIEALTTQDPKDHYVAQVRAKTTANIADIFIDLGETDAAKSVLRTCLRDIRPIQPQDRDWMDRHILVVCTSTASKLAVAEGNNAAALSMAEGALEVALENATGGNPDGPEEAAFALILVGDLLVNDGQVDLALRRYTQALDLRRAIAAALNDAQSRDRLSIALDRMGKIAELQRKFDEALTIYQEALAIADQRVKESPDNTLLIENLSIGEAKIGATLFRSGKPSEAVPHYRRALELRHQLVESDAANWHWRSLLAEANNRLAVSLANAGQLEEATPLFKDSISQYREIVAHDDKNTLSRHDLAIALNQFAFALAATDRPAAVAAFRESLPIFRALAAGPTPTPGALIDLAVTLLSAGEAGENPRGSYEEALSICLQLDAKDQLPPRMKNMLPGIRQAIDQLTKN